METREVKYIGPFIDGAEVMLPDGGYRRVAHGEVFTVPAEQADALLAQAANFADPNVDATEAAVALAADEGVELTSVTGTGSGGRVTVDDVRAAAAEQAGEQAPPDEPVGNPDQPEAVDSTTGQDAEGRGTLGAGDEGSAD